MKWVAFVILIVVSCIVFTGCAPGSNPSVDTPDSENDIAGFWMGLWHGMISIITFFISLFSSNVSVYEVHNSGGWYNFGFLLGLGAFAGAASSSKKRK
jgi:hypothetical protein